MLVTGFLGMLLTMLKFHTVMFNEVQGRGMCTFSKTYSEPHLKPEQMFFTFKKNFKALKSNKL